jgi:hypothetical protein
MEHQYILWIMTFAYAAHAFEERILNWKTWAKETFGVDVSWEMFYCANFTVVILGICCSSVGWRYPAFALSLPALALINSIFFHILPTITKRKLSPGLITAMFLFLPIGTLCYKFAEDDRMLNSKTIILSLLFGAVIMSFPFLLLRLKKKLDL